MLQSTNLSHALTPAPFFLLQTLGFNIEEMDKYFPIKNFDAVYLIDLCQPCVLSSSIPLRVDSP